jgi:hypothetical protein
MSLVEQIFASEKRLFIQNNVLLLSLLLEQKKLSILLLENAHRHYFKLNNNSCKLLVCQVT